MTSDPALTSLEQQLDAVERDAARLVERLGEAAGGWRSKPDSWSVAECLEHLATANTVYLAAMQEPAKRARAAGRLHRRPARPGLLGGLFVKSLEPPAKGLSRRRAPRKIRPRPSPPLRDAYARFVASQEQVRAFLHANADLDLAGVHFPNPFVRGLRFSLATGLHVIAAHERRHLWQAWNVRRLAERAAAA